MLLIFMPQLPMSLGTGKGDQNQIIQIYISLDTVSLPAGEFSKCYSAKVFGNQ